MLKELLREVDDFSYGCGQALKSYGLINVQEEESYGGISLKLTSTFSEAQIWFHL